MAGIFPAGAGGVRMQLDCNVISDACLLQQGTCSALLPTVRLLSAAAMMICLLLARPVLPLECVAVLLHRFLRLRVPATSPALYCLLYRLTLGCPVLLHPMLYYLQDIVVPIFMQPGLVLSYGMHSTPLHPLAPRMNRTIKFFFAGRICGDRKPPAPNTWPNCDLNTPHNRGYSAMTRQKV